MPQRPQDAGSENAARLNPKIATKAWAASASLSMQRPTWKAHRHAFEPRAPVRELFHWLRARRSEHAYAIRALLELDLRRSVARAQSCWPATFHAGADHLRVGTTLQEDWSLGPIRKMSLRQKSRGASPFVNGAAQRPLVSQNVMHHLLCSRARHLRDNASKEEASASNAVLAPELLM
jgi:hypothetical protein